MADDGETLSDAQLRDQLKLFGINAGPVTASTRTILLKKLKSVKSGESSPISTAAKAKKRRSVATSTPSRQRTKLSGFSSGEDDFPVKKSASVDSPSTASRRRSAFPRVRSVRNEDNDDSDGSSLDDKIPAVPKPVGGRRSLPRIYAQESKSFDTLPGAAKNGQTMVYDEEEDISLPAFPSYRKNSFEFEDDSKAGIIYKKFEEKKQNKREATSVYGTSSFAKRYDSRESVVSSVTTRKQPDAEDQRDSMQREVCFMQFSLLY